MFTNIAEFIIQNTVQTVLLIVAGLSFAYVAGRIITYPVEKELKAIKEIMMKNCSAKSEGRE